jgi:hypothetical protein
MIIAKFFTGQKAPRPRYAPVSLICCHRFLCGFP